MTKVLKETKDNKKKQLLRQFDRHTHFCKCLLDAFVLIDREGNIVKTNPLFSAMTKIGARHLQKKTLPEVLRLYLNNKEIPMSDLFDCTSPTRFDEIKGEVTDRDDLNLIIGLYPFIDDEGTTDIIGLFLLVRDVTAEAELQGKYRTKSIQSITCPLTGLFTRGYFESYLDQSAMGLAAIPEGSDHKDLSIIMIDIDHFKPVNDTYGHQAGDHIIKNLAEVMRKAFRKTDVLCRYGGEEYLAILPSTDLEGANIAAENFRKAVEKTKFSFNGVDIPISVSCGVAQILSSEFGRPANTIGRADSALYASKENGRNCVSYHDGTKAVSGVET